jgi:hypothetical protein
MPYILNKTNGTKLASLEDASLDVTTNLTFVGRNYSGYGEIVNENFIKLLENFSDSVAPTKPVLGQLWFDNSTDNRRLNVCYDGKNFKGIAALRVQSSRPTSSVEGDLWWDNSSKQLKAFNGDTYLTVGPITASSTNISWAFNSEIDTINNTNPMIKAIVKNRPILTITALTDYADDNVAYPESTSDLIDSTNVHPDFENGIRKGITLNGCDINGSSRAAGYYFWGTAAESLRAVTATSLTVAPVSAGTYFVPFVGTYSGSLGVVSSTSTFNYNAATGVLNATATAARYADLAERYEADAVYDIGTVLVIGGDKEVTVTNERGSYAVAGIVSKNPAYLMNSEAGNDETHPAIALKGRVFCKVVSTIKKGDPLVTSNFPGHATAFDDQIDNPAAILAIALESYPGGLPGVIEVKI